MMVITVHYGSSVSVSCRKPCETDIKWLLTQRAYEFKKANKWFFQWEERQISGDKIHCLDFCGKKAANIFTSCSQYPAFLQAFSLQNRIMKVIHSCLWGCCQCFTSSALDEHISLCAMAVFSKSNCADSLCDGSPNLCSVMHCASPQGNL